jgi:predicted HTH domain antitoxin
MNIPLPAELEGRISREEAALHLALGLFSEDKVTLGQAARIAGLSQPAFLQELGKRRIPVHYGMEELEQDIAAVREMLGARTAQ